MLGEPGLSFRVQVALGWLAGQEDTRVGQKGDVFGFSALPTAAGKTWCCLLQAGS